MSLILNALWTSFSLTVTWIPIRFYLCLWKVLSISPMWGLGLLAHIIDLHSVICLKTLLLFPSSLFCLESISNLSIHLYMISDSLRWAFLSRNLTCFFRLITSPFWQESTRLLIWVLWLTIALKQCSSTALTGVKTDSVFYGVRPLLLFFSFLYRTPFYLLVVLFLLSTYMTCTNMFKG